MNKAYGKQQRRLQRRDTKAQLDVSTKAFYQPDTTDCQEVSHVVELADPDFRIVHRLVTCDQKLVEYAVVLNRLQASQWVEVYSVDTEHGYLHFHRSGHARPNDRVNVRPLHTQVDVQESFDEAHAMAEKVYERVRS